jgi:hypothetical protein
VPGPAPSTTARTAFGGVTAKPTWVQLSRRSLTGRSPAGFSGPSVNSAAFVSTPVSIKVPFARVPCPACITKYAGCLTSPGFGGPGDFCPVDALAAPGTSAISAATARTAPTLIRR